MLYQSDWPIICFLFWLIGLAGPAAAQQGDVVVLNFDTSPWNSLAVEIAEAESTQVVNTWAGAMRSGAEFVLWVVAPTEVDDAVVVGLGQEMTKSKSIPALGLITGQDSVAARNLWLRRPKETGPITAINGENPASGVFDSRIVRIGASHVDTLELTPQAVREALEDSRYVTYAGHGTSTGWRLKADDPLRWDDLPLVDGVVIGTASCQTIRIWSPESIALAFVENGVAGYGGFVFSPLAGFVMGGYEGFPFLYTWQGFPIGQVVRAQTRGTLQGFATFPFHFWLGDPRAYLGSGQPYRVLSDDKLPDRRLISYDQLPEGIIPIRIAGGAEYAFVEARGVGSTWSGDPVYSKRIQAVDASRDKLLLVQHPGGELEVELRRNPPISRLVRGRVRGVLDTYLLFGSQSDGGLINAFLALVLVVIFALATARKKRPIRHFSYAAAVGVGFGIAHALYAILLSPVSGINSKPLAPLPLVWIATAVFVTLGAVIYLNATGWPGRIGGSLSAAAPAIISGLFAVALITAANTAMFKPRLGLPLYHVRLGWLPLQAGALIFLLFLVVMEPMRRLAGRD